MPQLNFVKSGRGPAVVLSHALGCDLSLWDDVVPLLERHCTVLRYDHRGHGQSEGQRGHTPSYDHLLNSVDDLLNKAQEFFPEIPQVLYGHSMGGGTTLELSYHGLNHSDSTLVMRLPKEKIIFVVDTIPVGTVPGRELLIFYGSPPPAGSSTSAAARYACPRSRRTRRRA